jgi:hypothetical protein
MTDIIITSNPEFYENLNTLMYQGAIIIPFHYVIMLITGIILFFIIKMMIRDFTPC